MTYPIRRPDWLEGVPTRVLVELAAAVSLLLVSILGGLVFPAVRTIQALAEPADVYSPVVPAVAVFAMLGLGLGAKWLDRVEDKIVAAHDRTLGGAA